MESPQLEIEKPDVCREKRGLEAPLLRVRLVANVGARERSKVRFSPASRTRRLVTHWAASAARKVAQIELAHKPIQAIWYMCAPKPTVQTLRSGGAFRKQTVR